MSYEKIQEKLVRVRKDHECIWCGEQIAKGTSAQYRAYTFYDDFCSDYMHPECYDAMSKMDPYEMGDGFLSGEYKRGEAGLR